MLVTTLALLLSIAQTPPKEGVIKSEKDPKTNFASFTTYSWVQGWPAADRVAHKAVTDGIEAELAALGFKKVDKGASVTIRYFTTLRTDVDLKSLEEMERQGKPPVMKNLGRLVIVMRDATDKRVWAADTVQPVSSDAATRADEIRKLVARMFETYTAKAK
jgi:hypothetical protein